MAQTVVNPADLDWGRLKVSEEWQETVLPLIEAWSQNYLAEAMDATDVLKAEQALGAVRVLKTLAAAPDYYLAQAANAARREDELREAEIARERDRNNRRNWRPGSGLLRR